MMSHRPQLGPMQLDLLQEVGNIGGGNAATALSQVLRARVDVQVPRALVLPLREVAEVVGGAEAEVVGVLQVLGGDLAGHLLYLCPIHGARRLTSRVLGREVDAFGEMEISALCEVANILTGTYLTALARMTGMRIKASPPADARDMIGALVDGTLAAFAGTTGDVLFLENQFLLAGGAPLGVSQLFMPSEGGLDRLLQAFGMAS